MLISSSYDTENIFGVDAPARKTWSRVQDTTLPSGDTVDISSEAKELYSKMIHKYDQDASSPKSENQSLSSGQASGGSISGGDSGVEKIKNQIQSLKSQLSSLTSQMGESFNPAAMGKINALQVQIAALEAQLSEMQAA